MNNEPVAWILNGIIHEFDPSDWAKEQYPDQDVIPLYTHPAKTPTLVLDGNRVYPAFKTLTDEEITNLFRASSDHIEFARAILRKAQEK